ncbi:chromatin-remodeling ATPase INO80 [Solanum dulcamara]|uniref:chromatin-remodeling ATPase INO80 n=1 Tax=Solanum dulcamara TaxID=45834 RepID=UPI002484E3EA|nr:chromatin-remodeling ATPase INO80 [Solanum dulcamara]
MDSGSLYSNMSPGMLGLEMSLHHQIPQQNTHPQLHQQPPPHHPIVAYAHQENADNQQQAALRQVFPFSNNKAKSQSLNFSDDDEPVPGASADNNSTDDGKRISNKTCPWQRMKWTDNMVRLLIMVVYYIGDEVGSEGNNNSDPSGKKKSGGGGGGGVGVGVLQKKGKWKSVSRAMMERGFYVSPQQCEDKFNDLNKRYKRVNDILGKGTSCRVVENQKLLETMDHLSPKMKEEVKKLLNSKHLFFREMCAYHNSCGQNGGGGGASGSGVANSQAHQNQLEQQQQQRCMHSSENANSRIGASLVEGPKMPKGASGENNEENEDEEEDEDEDEEDDDDEVSGARGHDHDHNHHSHEEDDDMDERSRKRQRKLGTSSPMVQQLSIELANVVQDRGRSPLEKRQWMKTRMIQLEEQHVGYLCQAFELQKQRLKWKKFISKKEREMERDKLINERKKLENERMVLLLKQKELELLDYHQHHPNNNNRNSDPSSVTG